MNEEVVTTERYWKKPTKGQKELYLYLRHKFECGEDPHESEIFEIYANYVTPINKWRLTNNEKWDEERIHKCARAWFKASISSLVFLGWFGLQFKRKVELA